MAGNRKATGLNVYTVQEATNAIAQRKVIRVFPTLAAAAISGTAGDVLVNPTAIPNAVLQPGGCSSLVTTHLADYADVLSSEDFLIIFHQANAADFGTQDATANISIDDLKSSKFLGFKHWDNSSSGTVGNIDNVHLLRIEGSAGENDEYEPFLLQAEEGSTDVYFSVIQGATSGATPDWDTGDLEFIFHIEY